MVKRTADIAMGPAPSKIDQPSQPRKRAVRSCAPPRLPQPLYKASVASLAATANNVAASTADIDGAVIAKIKKCLDRANHPATPQAEAKAAFYLASREMAKFNVTQAQILAHESPSVQKQHAGQSDVLLFRADGDTSKGVQHQAWLSDVCRAMGIFFDCKFYSEEGRSSLRLTFYGIAENTIGAAMGLETAYNLIAEWARSYKGNGPRHSYCLGVCKGLERTANEYKAAEARQAKLDEEKAIAVKEKQAEVERQAQLDRLVPLLENSTATTGSPPANHARFDSDDDSDDDNHGDGHEMNTPLANDATDTSSPGLEDFQDDGFGPPSPSSVCSPENDDDDDGENDIEPDFKVEDEDHDHNLSSIEDIDEAIRRLVKPEPLSPPPSSSSSAAGDAVAVSIWASHMQLVTFRATASRIADDYLREQDTKLGTRRAKSTVIRDWGAYDQGVVDSKKINVHQKRIEGSAGWVNEHDVTGM